MSTLHHIPKRLLVGRPLHSDQMGETLLPKKLALPVFCSDPLSSNAYATEEILLVLGLGGLGLLHLTPWVAAAVLAWLVIVVLSYRQTCRAYPSGGGAYAVSRANVGRRAALVAASALLVDYVLTVTVSVAAGVANVVSAVPALAPHAVSVSVGMVGAELRGVTPEQILDQVRDVYGMRTVTLLDPDGRRPVVSVGPPPSDGACLSVEVGETPRLVGYGATPFAEDRVLLRALAEAAARVWDRQELAAEAARAEQLAEADRVRSALLTAVSHDLRTPIASIKTGASGLQHDAISLTDSDRRELLKAIEEGADRLAGLVDDLLAMSRIQAGAVPLNLEAVSLEEVLARATRDVDEGRVDVTVPEDLPLVRADAALLERVVANIVQNAVRFGPPDVPIHVDAAVAAAAGGQADSVDLRVMDRGPGVPAGRHGEMFVPFQRLGDTSPEGVGLGLAIARGLAEAMGGSLTPSSTPGGGLTMTVRLPVTA